MLSKSVHENWGRKIGKIGDVSTFLALDSRKVETSPFFLFPRKGFTFIEILIALVVIAVLFIPMIQLFSSAIYSVTVSGEGITSVNLARWEMERVKNLNVTKAGLVKIGNLWTPELAEPPLEMNQAKWRILRRVLPDTDPLEVDVEVYRNDNLNKPVVSVATLIEDSIWI